MSEAALSTIDASVFGVPVARVLIEHPDEVSAAERFCRNHGVRLLVARCHAGDVVAIHRLSAAGHLLMDTQCRNSCRVAVAARRPADPRYPIRPATTEDAPTLRALANDAFGGYASHYHADPRLDRDRCDEVYIQWVLEALDARRPDEWLFMAEHDGQPTGFGLFRVRDRVGEALLAGTARKSGVARAFVFAALLREGTRGALAAGAVRAFTSTNVANVVVQRILLRARWAPSDAIHTFHRWFDE